MHVIRVFKSSDSLHIPYIDRYLSCEGKKKDNIRRVVVLHQQFHLPSFSYLLVLSSRRLLVSEFQATHTPDLKTVFDDDLIGATLNPEISLGNMDLDKREGVEKNASLMIM